MSTSPDDGRNAWRRQELVWALRWLAAEPDAALTAVDGVVTSDEIALDVEQWFETAQEWGLLDERLTGSIAAIDNEFSRMADLGPDLWTDEAIRTSLEWAKQRERARQALAEMGELRDDAGLGKPRPGGPVYVVQKRR